MELKPTTELEAVNIMLGTVGEAPVTAIEQSGVSASTIAYNILRESTRAVETIGLACNSEREYPLVRNTDGEIVLSPDLLRITPFYQDDDFVKRGNRLYDRRNHTYTFTEDKKANVVFFLDFSDLPESVRYYITIKAARIYQKRTMGSDTLDGFTAVDEGRAWNVMFADELQESPSNIQDSWDVYKIIARR